MGAAAQGKISNVQTDAERWNAVVFLTAHLHNSQGRDSVE
jgi:hypothetical protein